MAPAAFIRGGCKARSYLNTGDYPISSCKANTGPSLQASFQPRRVSTEQAPQSANPAHGKDLNGNAVSNGAYTFEVQAEGTGGEKLGVTTYSKGTVTGVTFEDGVTYLIVGRGKVAIGDVTQVKQSSASSAL